MLGSMFVAILVCTFTFDLFSFQQATRILFTSSDCCGPVSLSHCLQSALKDPRTYHGAPLTSS